MTGSHVEKVRLKLRLYVAGNAANSLLAIANLRAICDEHFEAGQIEIVDLLEFPARGLVDGVVVTPTLIRLFPRPVQKIIGNLSDTSKVIMALSLK